VADPTLPATATLDSRRARGLTRPCLFLVLQAGRPLAPGARLPLGDVDEVHLGRGATETRQEPRRLVVTLDDPRASTSHARLVKRLGRWLVEDLGSTNGTIVNGERVTQVELGDRDLLEVGRSFLVYRDAVLLDPGDGPALPQVSQPPGFATLVPSFARELARLAQVASSQVSVMLRGETGTGKEVAARGVHALSGRRGELVAVNCGALPRELVESALFGHRKGAFSGAIADHPGLVRTADGGTLFLDEIGDLPLPSQAALLRVLQEREVIPVGGLRASPVDLRVVAATHRDLEEEVAAGRFRADLLARLAGFTIELPPLRERREDLGLLTATLLERLGASGSTLHPHTVRALFASPWRGNIRELAKALETAVVLAGGRPIAPEHLPESVRTSHRPEAPAVAPGEEELREKLLAAFREQRGNIHGVARAMGKARTQIQRWMKRFQIDPDSFR
jgi:hypothetical protein